MNGERTLEAYFLLHTSTLTLQLHLGKLRFLRLLLPLVHLRHLSGGAFKRDAIVNCRTSHTNLHSLRLSSRP